MYEDDLLKEKLLEALLDYIKKNQFQIVKFVLFLKANPNLPNLKGDLPLHLAVINNGPEMVALLLSNGAFEGTMSAKGRTLLVDAILSTSITDAVKVQNIRLLLAAGADPNQICADNNTGALREAAYNHYIVIIGLLLFHGANPNGLDANTPLVNSLVKKNTQEKLMINTIRILLEAGADPNIAEPTSGNYPIHHAAKLGFYKVARLLIEHNARLDVLNESRESPLFLTTNRDGSDSLFRMLLEKGADPNFGGYNPLQAATYNGNIERVNLLLQFDATVDVLNRDGQTALHIAARSERIRASHKKTIIKKLLEEGADPNIRDGEGKTPLHQAVKAMGYYHNPLEAPVEIVTLFLSYGADPTILTNDGKMPIDLAINQVVQLVLKAASATYLFLTDDENN